MSFHRPFRPDARRLVHLLATMTALVVGAQQAGAEEKVVHRSTHAPRLWTNQDGLPHNSVTSLAQTPDGYLWVGTTVGLGRFDGLRFVAFTADTTPALAVHGVTTLLADGLEGLWIGTLGDVLTRHRDGIFTKFNEFFGGFPSLRVQAALRARSGELWLGGLRGLVRWTERGGARPTPRFSRSAVSSLCESDDGTIWVVHDGRLAQGRGGDFEEVVAPGERPPGRVAAIACQGQDVWIGSEGRGLFRWRDGRIERPVEAAALAEATVTALHFDRAKVLWVGTNRGLWRVQGSVAHRFDSVRDGVPNDVVTALLDDREGNLWVGLHASGLLRLSPTKFGTFVIAQAGRPVLLSALHEASDGALWAGAEDGELLRLDGRALNVFSRAHGLCVTKIHDLSSDRDGGLWIAGQGGDGSNLCRFAGGRFERIETPREGTAELEPMHRLLRDRNETLWVGGRQLYQLRGHNLALVPRPTADPNVFALEEDPSGRIWVGGSESLQSFRDGHWEVPRRARPSPTVYSLLPDEDGSLWIGTLRGLGQLNAGVASGFGAANGLPVERVFSLVDDRLGSLWLGTPRGIVQVAKGSLRGSPGAPPSPLTAFGRAEGLANPRWGRSLRRADGTLWFLTPRGVAFIDPARVRRNTVVPSVVIERVFVDGEPLGRGDMELAPPGRHHLQIDFTALSFTAPENVRFRHRLEPTETTWTEGTARRVSYANLGPGVYRFRVRACNDDGVWNEEGASVQLRFAPHYHETKPFRAALLVALMFAIWGAHRFRLRTQAAQHRAVLAERNRIARDIHDSLAQGFAALSLVLQSARRRLQSGSDVAAALTDAEALVASSLADARQAIDALREGGGPDLLSALRAVGRQLSGEVPIEILVQGQPRPLPAEVEAALLRLGQESLVNAVKHAKATEIRATLRYGFFSVGLRVQDNGAGLPARPPGPGHYGLIGMHERVSELGGRLEISSASGRGTEVLAWLPVRQRRRRWLRKRS